MKLISIKEAARIFGVTTTTLRNWEKQKKITSIRTLGGHRRYNLDELNLILNELSKNL